jgi:hypothetical protein
MINDKHSHIACPPERFLSTFNVTYHDDQRYSYTARAENAGAVWCVGNGGVSPSGIWGLAYVAVCDVTRASVSAPVAAA